MPSLAVKVGGAIRGCIGPKTGWLLFAEWPAQPSKIPWDFFSGLITTTFTNETSCRGDEEGRLAFISAENNKAEIRD
jgi:hypothetical protein